MCANEQRLGMATCNGRPGHEPGTWGSATAQTGGARFAALLLEGLSAPRVLVLKETLKLVLQFSHCDDKGWTHLQGDRHESSKWAVLHSGAGRTVRRVQYIPFYPIGCADLLCIFGRLHPFPSLRLASRSGTCLYSANAVSAVVSTYCILIQVPSLANQYSS